METFWIQVAMGAFKTFSFVYDVITFPIYLILQKPWKRRQLAKKIRVSSKYFNFKKNLRITNILKIFKETKKNAIEEIC